MMDIGDLVRLKSGGPIMAVGEEEHVWVGMEYREVPTGRYFCDWFDEFDDRHQGRFHPHQLVPADLLADLP